MSHTLRPLAFAAFFALGVGGALAGTGTCTGAGGAVVNGSTCCAALKGTNCRCNESGASVSGTVSCTAADIKDGSTAEVQSISLPTNRLKADTGGGDGNAQIKSK